MPSVLETKNYIDEFRDDVPKIAVIIAKHPSIISDELTQETIGILDTQKISYKKIYVSGILELPIALKLVINSSQYEGYILLGSISFEENVTYSKAVYTETLRSIGNISNQGYPTGTAIISAESAIELKKTSLKNNYGAAAANAVLGLISLSRNLTGIAKNIGFKPLSNNNQTAGEAKKIL